MTMAQAPSPTAPGTSPSLPLCSGAPAPAPFASWSSRGFRPRRGGSSGSGSGSGGGRRAGRAGLRHFLTGRPSATLVVALLFLGFLFVMLPSGLGEELELLTAGSAGSSGEVAQNGEAPAADGASSLQPPQAGGVMEDLLHWAIQHSDPETLKEVMKKYQDSNLTLKDVYGQDVLDALFVDEAASIRHLVDQLHDFRNDSVPDEDLLAVLDRLEEFVEQVDNAGNLHKLGGLRPLMDCALPPADEEPGAKRSSEVRARALLVLGVATQNNPPVQADVLSLGGLERLLASLPTCSDDGEEAPAYCAKLLFAISALVRNDGEIQERASALGLFQWLARQGLRGPSHSVVKKALGILETVVGQNPSLPFIGALVDDRQLQDELAKTLLDLVEQGDFDTVEKALRLLGRLLESHGLLFASSRLPPPRSERSFLDWLTEAFRTRISTCEAEHGIGDEICENLQALATEASEALRLRETQEL